MHRTKTDNVTFFLPLILRVPLFRTVWKLERLSSKASEYQCIEFGVFILNIGKVTFCSSFLQDVLLIVAA